VRDEAKKDIWAIETPERGDTAPVKAVFELLFRKYGPRYIRRDNGPPFTQSVGIEPVIGMGYEPGDKDRP
jgi:hypothetical protein